MVLLFFTCSQRGIIDGFIFQKIPDNSYYDEKDEDLLHGKDAIFIGIWYVLAGCLGLVTSIGLTSKIGILFILNKLNINILSILIIIALALLFLVVGSVMMWRFIRDGFIKQKIIGVGGDQEYIYGNHAKIIGTLGIVSSSFLLYTAYIFVKFLVKLL